LLHKTQDAPRKKNGISQKENGCVVANQIPIPFFGKEFDGKAPRIARRIRRARLPTHRRKANRHWGFLALFTEHGSFANALNEIRLCDFEITSSARALGVHDTFRNAFTVEMGQVINEVEILQNNRTRFRPSSHACRQRVDGSTVAGHKHLFLVARLLIVQLIGGWVASGGGHDSMCWWIFLVARWKPRALRRFNASKRTVLSRTTMVCLAIW